MADEEETQVMAVFVRRDHVLKELNRISRYLDTLLAEITDDRERTQKKAEQLLALGALFFKWVTDSAHAEVQQMHSISAAYALAESLTEVPQDPEPKARA